jgi:hypothetical protein
MIMQSMSATTTNIYTVIKIDPCSAGSRKIFASCSLGRLIDQVSKDLGRKNLQPQDIQTIQTKLSAQQDIYQHELTCHYWSYQFKTIVDDV